jgi:hypothetical protein
MENEQWKMDNGKWKMKNGLPRSVPASSSGSAQRL